MTRAGRQNIDPCMEKEGVVQGTAPYLSMLINNIALSGSATENVPPDYIILVMALTGGAVYIRSENTWAEFASTGKADRFGFPRNIMIRGDDLWSGSFPVTDNYAIFPANAEFVPPINTINKIVTRLNEIELNIGQNLDNLRQMTVVKTTSIELTAQARRLDQKRRQGDTHGVLVVGSQDETAPFDILDFSPKAQSYLLEYLQLKQDCRQELYEAVGVAKLVEKGERRIVGEVDLASDSASAVIDLMIESINKFAKFYGVDVKAERRLRAGHTCDPAEAGTQAKEGEETTEDE